MTVYHPEPAHFVSVLTREFRIFCVFGLCASLALAAAPLLLGVAAWPGYGWVPWASLALTLVSLVLFLWIFTLGTSIYVKAGGVRISVLWFFSAEIPYSRIRRVEPGPVLSNWPGARFPKDWGQEAYSRQLALSDQGKRGNRTLIQGFSTGGPTLVFTLTDGSRIFASAPNPEYCALVIRRHLGV